MQHQNQWYVQVNGQSYGPYSIAQMIAYIGEGRIIANSLISQDPAQGFGLAVGFPVFSGQLAPYASPQVLQQAHSQNQLQHDTPPQHSSQGAAPAQPLSAPAAEQPLRPIAPMASAPRSISPRPRSTASHTSSAPSNDRPLALTPEMSLAQDRPTAPAQGDSLFLIMAEVASENRMKFLQTLQNIGTPQRIGESNWLMQSAKDIDDIRNSLAAALTRQDRLFIMDSVKNRTAWFNIGTDTAKRIKQLWKPQ